MTTRARGGAAGFPDGGIRGALRALLPPFLNAPVMKWARARVSYAFGFIRVWMDTLNVSGLARLVSAVWHWT